MATGAQIYSSPFSGSALKSSNSRTWISLAKEQVKFEISVANFSLTPGYAYFENDNDDFINFKSLSLTNSNNSIQIGDEVYLSYANGSIQNTSVKALVQNLDTVNSKLRLDTSTGGFAANSYISVYRLPQYANTSQANSTNRVAVLQIDTIENKKIHALVPRFSTITPISTNIQFEYKGTSNSGITDTTWQPISLNNEKEFIDYERMLVSRSLENTFSLNSSLTYKAMLTTDNKYLSPIIDLTSRSAIVIENIINNDITNEETKYGNAIAKYVSKPVVLDAGQDAEDLLVYVTGFRPSGTDIKVYTKLINAEDYNKFDDKLWSIMDNQSPEIYSSSMDTNDFREFQFKLPFSAITGGAFRDSSNFNIVKYIGTSGEIYLGFKQFAIKIVMVSDSPNTVPIVNDVRCIALQV